jgi:hypothetical protein
MYVLMVLFVCCLNSHLLGLFCVSTRKVHQFKKEFLADYQQHGVVKEVGLSF